MNLTSNKDYFERIYLEDRDERVGSKDIKNSGSHTLTFSNLLPGRDYTLCSYLSTESNLNLVSESQCSSTKTDNWGTIYKAFLKFDTPLTDENLNKILCFFVTEVGTEVNYIVDLEGNSCSTSTVSNLYYNYNGESVSN